MRRLPDGLAPRRRRAAKRALPRDARPRDHRPRHRSGRGHRACGRHARRRAVARRNLRRLPPLCKRSRESLREGGIHRLHARRRLRRARDRRRTVLPADPGPLFGPRRGAAFVRGPNRLPRVPPGWRRPEPRPLRIRRRGPFARADRACERPPGVRVHASRRRRGATLRARARRRLGRRPSRT